MRVLKTILLGSALFLCTARAETSWTGFYIGAEAGYGSGESALTFPNNNSGDSTPYDPDGAIGAVYAGYDWQMENVVIGLDADFTFGGPESDDFVPFTTGTGQTFPNTGGSSEVNWSGALRLRAGYAYDRLLPYIAVGVAVADYDYVSFENLSIYNGHESLTGWTVAIGFDYAATEHATARIEVRHSDFGDKDVDGTANIPDHLVDLAVTDVRAGIAWRF